MNDEAKKNLQDILDSINGIEQYLNGKRDFKEFEQNRMLRKAIERELEIIGEATNRILQTTPDIVITGARSIVNMRNKVIHAYDAVNNTIVWAIVNNHLPVLKAEVEKLMKD
jgi:uncharacterized protein with HEPN domain